MSQQNIYDRDVFFENFKSIRDRQVNFNDLLETPVLLSMLPDLKEKTVLDIGCGMGQHAKQFCTLGAKMVLGIDISEKMLSYARKNNSAQNIFYKRITMEEIDKIDQKFDVITSSLAFDYVEDFEDLARKIYNCMNADGVFVFSTSHPMATAYDGQYPRFTRSESGEKLYANINNYFVEGKRKIKWVVDDYELYHRTFSSIVNALVKSGFIIQECHESLASEQLRERHPSQFDGTLHRPDFIFFKCSKCNRWAFQFYKK